MLRDMTEFDQEHAAALKAIWFLGDVHGSFAHIAQALLDAPEKPRWLVFLGDIDIDHKPFKEILEPLSRNFPQIRVAFIHGNHDADTYDHWAMLHDCGDAQILHGQVLDLEGVRVAGLGGQLHGPNLVPTGTSVIPKQETGHEPRPLPMARRPAAKPESARRDLPRRYQRLGTPARRYSRDARGTILPSSWLCGDR